MGIVEKKKQLLYIVNELPYPPRNGVTIPSFHYLNGIDRDSYEVDLLYLPRKANDTSQKAIEVNAEKVDNLIVINLQKQSSFTIIADFLFGRKPTYFGYDYNVEDHRAFFSHRNYSVIIFTPISALIFKQTLSKLFDLEKVFLAGILSDCFSYSVKQFALLDDKVFNLGFKQKVFLRLKYFQSFRERYFERRVIKDLDLLVCQTAVDEAAFKELGFPNRILVQSNGVDIQLYKKEVSFSKVEKILFLGVLNEKYEYISELLISQLWPQLKEKFPNLKFKIVGKGLAPHLQKQVQSDQSIEYFSYIDSLADAYDDCQVLLAPIFINCGLVNKTIEGMASGLVVIGDKSAFNGIPNFSNGDQGLVINNISEITEQITKLINDDELVKSIQQKAKLTVTEHFSWQQKADNFNRLLRSK